MASALVRHGVHLISATPAQLRLILDNAGPVAPSVRVILCGGAKLDPALRDRLAVRFPAAAIHEFYGTSEASFVTLADATTPPHAVGRPYPGVEIDLRGPEDAAQVWVRSPYLFEGYAAEPGSARWQEGWLCTGEIARWDGTDLVLTGRADRMLTVADQNVFPEEIEAFLLTLPGVTRAAVLPRRDPARGHVVEAVVEGGDAKAILATCRSALGPLKAPRRLHRIAGWPLLPSGKTDFAALERLLT
jgi:long-chain acyl-CoA synthetase